MRIHPEIREQFEEAMRYHMVYWCKLTPDQIEVKLREWAIHQQKALLGKGALVCETIKRKTCDCSAGMWPMPCDCPIETEVRFKRMTKEEATKDEKSDLLRLSKEVDALFYIHGPNKGWF